MTLLESRGFAPEYFHLPYPTEHVDLSWNKTEREIVISYLEHGNVHASWRGISLCRICRKHNGSQCLSDSTFVWPSGYAHYVKEHGVKPPQEFVDHVMQRLGAIQ